MLNRVGLPLAAALLVGFASYAPAPAQERKVQRTDRQSGKQHTTGSVRQGERSSGSSRSAVRRGDNSNARRNDGNARRSDSSDRRGDTRGVETRHSAQRGTERRNIDTQRIQPRGSTVIANHGGNHHTHRVVRREPRYYRPVSWGTRVTVLPPRHTTVVINNNNYYCHEGVYYAPDPRLNQYVVVRPPLGVQVEYIPSDSIQVSIGGFNFYYYDDCWYDESLTVVDVPVGGYVYSLPPQYETVVYQDVSYYRAGGAYYRPYIREGRTAYLRVDLRF